jgi:MscS family membrane protein
MHFVDSLARLRGLLTPASLVVAVWVLASLLAGRLFGWLTRGLLRRLARQTTTPWDDQILTRLGGPFTMGWALAFAYLGLAILDVSPTAELNARGLLRSGVVATVFWVFWRLIDVAEHLVGHSEWAKRRVASLSFIALASRAAKVAVVILGGLTMLSRAGYPVGTLIAGLGIGGLALALGAQKTLENVFGAFSLAADQPFHLGDLVKIENVTGTIESIGLRSTRIRTPDRSVVVIPNGKLAEMKTESMAARDRMRLACTLGLVYQTKAAQLRQVLEGIEGALRAHPKVWPGDVGVHLTHLAASAIEIEVAASFTTPDGSEFNRIRQDLLLRFIEIVEAAGSAFAYPTQTIHVATAKAV